MPTFRSLNLAPVLISFAFLAGCGSTNPQNEGDIDNALLAAKITPARDVSQEKYKASTNGAFATSSSHQFLLMTKEEKKARTKQAEAESSRQPQSLPKLDPTKAKKMIELTSEPKPQAPGKGKVVVQFDFDSDELTIGGRNTLEASIVEFKKADDIAITGHTDSAGPATYNLLLSQRRAGAVKNFLVKKGIPAQKMSLVGEGEGNPEFNNATSDGRRKNRQVIAVY